MDDGLVPSRPCHHSVAIVKRVDSKEACSRGGGVRTSANFQKTHVCTSLHSFIFQQFLVCVAVLLFGTSACIPYRFANQCVGEVQPKGCSCKPIEMDVVGLFSYVYGSALVLGGAIGGMKGSTVSLVAGGAIGTTILLLENLAGGAGFARIVQTFLAGATGFQMYQRYQTSGKFMPAGMVAGLSVVYCLANIAALSGALSAKAKTK